MSRKFLKGVGQPGRPVHSYRDVDSRSARIGQVNGYPHGPRYDRPATATNYGSPGVGRGEKGTSTAPTPHHEDIMDIMAEMSAQAEQES